MITVIMFIIKAVIRGAKTSSSTRNTKIYKSSTMKLEKWLVRSFSWMFPLGY